VKPLSAVPDGGIVKKGGGGVGACRFTSFPSLECEVLCCHSRGRRSVKESQDRRKRGRGSQSQFERAALCVLKSVEAPRRCLSRQL